MDGLCSSELPLVLRSRRWLRSDYPFHHVVARDVFLPQVYDGLCAAFSQIEARGLANGPSADRLGRNLRGYDAYGFSITPDTQGMFRLFVSRPWHDLLAGLFDVAATGEIAAGLHYHVPGSAHGRIHNDLNPGWFRDDDIGLTDTAISDWRRWSYFDGVSTEASLYTRERIRAVAMIYYLHNPPWRAGDGGETGLYTYGRQAIETPEVAVPPLNNSLIAFECTPSSYHTFISNRRRERRSVILWLHRTKEDAVARWGERAIVRWRSN